MTTTLAPAVASRRVLLVKAQGDFKHSGKYFLHNGRWHKLHQDKPVPKGAPIAAHPEAGGSHGPAKHFSDDEWAQLKLPADNVNAGSYNKHLDKLKELSEAGHVTGILGMQYGTNTYGKKAAIVANKLLELHGSPHKVVPGQKAGEHAAVQGSPAAGQPDADLSKLDLFDANAPVPADKKAMLDKWHESGDKSALQYTADANKKTNPHIAAYAQKLADSLQPAAQGPHSADLIEGWKESLLAGKVPTAEQHAAWQALGDAGNAVLGQVGMSPKYTKAAHKAFKDAEAKYGKADATDPKDGDTKQGADGTLVFKDGRWHKQVEAAAPAQDSGLSVPEFQEGKTKKGVKAYYEKVAAKIKAAADAGDVAALEAMYQPDKGNTWAGKTGNSKTLLAMHQKALASLKGNTADQPAPAVSAEPVPAPAAPAAEASPTDENHVSLDSAKTDALAPTLSKKVFNSDNPVWFTQKNATDLNAHGNLSLNGQGPSSYSKQALAEYQAAKAAGYSYANYKVSGLQHAYVFEKDGQILTKKGMAALMAGQGAAAPAEAAPAKQREPISLAEMGVINKLNDWKKNGNLSSLEVFVEMVGSDDQYKTALKVAKQYIDELKTKQDQPPAGPGVPQKPDLTGSTWAEVASQIEDAIEHGDEELISNNIAATEGLSSDASKKVNQYAKDALAYLQNQNAAAPAPAPAAPPTQSATENLAKIQWHKQLLPDSNKNAKSHNKQVAKIMALAEAGDIAGLEALKFGINTYGKKQELLKQTAIAALKQGGQTPAAAPAPSASKIKVKGVEYTKQADGSWSSKDGDATPSSPMGLALALMNGDKPDLSGKTDIQKEVISELMVEAGMKPEQALSTVYGSGDDGPKEGDTKEINGVTYQLKNGRWHKVSPDEKAAQDATAAPEPAAADEQHPVDAVPHPDISVFKPTGQAKITQGLETLKEKIKAGDLSALKGITKKMSKTGKLIVKLPMPNGYPITVTMKQDSPTGQSMEAYIDALKGAAGKPPKASKPKAAAAAPAPNAPDHSGVESMDNWTQTGPQGGSNPGGRFKDADGVEWYCKFPGDEDVAKSEVLAAQLYALAGVAGQDAKLITKGGKLGIASRWVDVKKSNGPSHLAGVEGVQAGFAVDAWLGNWDVVGLSYDNLQIGADGKAVRVDAGGSLQYRAQGGKKAFGNTVSEIDSLRDAKVNPQAAAVFGSMTQADITASVKKVASISDDDIYDLVMKHGPGDHENKAHLIETLIERKNDLLAKFPKAVKKEKAKPKPDPTKLKVDASQLPKPHDFMNWKGQGEGLSSKQHVNEANLKAEQDLLESALNGNLIALKDYHFEAVDKETGASLGKKPIEEHPSQHVKLYWSDLVSTLSYIAYPPEALKKFKSVVAGSIKKVSDAFKSQSYGVTTNKVEANSRLAFWIALGHTKPVEALLPPGKTTQFESSPAGIPPMTEAMRSSAKTAYAALGSGRLVKRFINGIQASGTYNDNFRDGKMVTSDDKDAVAMVLDAYDFAAEKPEGFEIFKWMSFSGDMGKQLLNTPPGTVFQNPGSMCCSYMPNATSGFGADRVRIRYAKGAKAVDSFGSGSFSSEKEITTLPGQRFVILSCKKVHCPVKGKERIELDVLMLPPDESYVAELHAQKGIHGKAAA